MKIECESAVIIPRLSRYGLEVELEGFDASKVAADCSEEVQEKLDEATNIKVRHARLLEVVAHLNSEARQTMTSIARDDKTGATAGVADMVEAIRLMSSILKGVA